MGLAGYTLLNVLLRYPTWRCQEITGQGRGCRQQLRPHAADLPGRFPELSGERGVRRRGSGSPLHVSEHSADDRWQSSGDGALGE